MFLIVFGPNIICVNKEQINKSSTISSQYALVPKTLKDEDRK